MRLTCATRSKSCRKKARCKGKAGTDALGKNELFVKGAREHNLKNIDIHIPRDKLIVFTGLSGSGKSSLAFDTIYAEGQRRYVESLSSYARQFLGQMDKPISITSRASPPPSPSIRKRPPRTRAPRWARSRRIYDYLRLLYARIGVPHCPVCGRENPPADDRSDCRSGAGAAGALPASRCWPRWCADGKANM